MNDAPGNVAGSTASNERATKRTFVAIELPSAAHTWVQTLQRACEERLRSDQLPFLFQWTPPEKLHITLRFLGETTLQQEQSLVSAINRWAIRCAPFHLYLQDIGSFPKRGAPKVLWTGVHGDLAELTRCQSQLEAIAQATGFSAEQRAYTPHLTIARAQRNALPAQLAKARQSLFGTGQVSTAPAQIVDNPPHIAVEHIVLMQSELLAQGARYTPLAYFVLG